MIQIENVEVMGWEAAIRGMRNPMNSWARSDSEFSGNNADIGDADHDLMLRLASAGSVDGKFRRMITVYVDITAPLYWWKEFDTYKVGTVANSTSTMHRLTSKPFEVSDFSFDHLIVNTKIEMEPFDIAKILVDTLNELRDLYLKTKSKNVWWQMIQLLPSSYNQKRTIMMNYEVLANIYQHRRNHKLDEWRVFCKWIEILPYSEVITCSVKGDAGK